MTQQWTHDDWMRGLTWPNGEYGGFTPAVPHWPNNPLSPPQPQVEVPYVDALRRALETFGDHRVRCRIIQDAAEESACTCGWLAVKSVLLGS